MTLLLLLSSAPNLAVTKDVPATVAESKTEQDAANIQLVKSFLAAWKDPDHGVKYLSRNVVARMTAEEPALVGRLAYLENFSRHGFGPDWSISVKINEIYARDPVVVILHTATFRRPGKPDTVYDTVGIAAVKNGKITEWIGYLPHDD